VITVTRDAAYPTIRKQPADSVPYGPDISTTGKWVYVAYDGDVLVAVAATVREARRKYRDAQARLYHRNKIKSFRYIGMGGKYPPRLSSVYASLLYLAIPSARLEAERIATHFS
jgi:hypothetical protein